MLIILMFCSIPLVKRGYSTWRQVTSWLTVKQHFNMAYYYLNDLPAVCVCLFLCLLWINFGNRLRVLSVLCGRTKYRPQIFKSPSGVCGLQLLHFQLCGLRLCVIIQVCCWRMITVHCGDAEVLLSETFGLQELRLSLESFTNCPRGLSSLTRL